MKKSYLLILSVAVLAASCGPSQEEIKAQEKRVADSLEIVRQDSIAFVKERLEMERIHLQKIEVGQSLLETELANMIDKFKGRLTKENAKLNEINEFQWGRAQSTKDEQLYAQYEIINEIESNIKRIEKEISMSKLFNSFDFQETPRGTIEHVFNAAKNDDTEKMRHLLDPYGEYDTDVLYLCHVEMLTDNQKQEWKSVFGNGRIMSDPVISDNRAEVEVAIGSSANKLEKFKLVERMGKWYITSL